MNCVREEGASGAILKPAGGAEVGGAIKRDTHEHRVRSTALHRAARLGARRIGLTSLYLYDNDGPPVCRRGSECGFIRRYQTAPNATGSDW